MKNVNGDMAQLVERLVRNEEASGSNPLSSTKTKTRRFDVFFCFVAKRSPKRCIRSGSCEEPRNVLIFLPSIYSW